MIISERLFTMNKELFLQTYEKNSKTIYTVAYNYLKNSDDAAEITQETFMKFYTYEESFKDDEHIKAWLIRVDINLCKNHLRNRKKFSDEPIPDDIPSKEEEQNNDLLEIVMKLPEKYRIPVHLFYYEDYSLKQIADVLDLTEGTVKTRLKRGREKLQKILRKDDWIL